MLHSFYNCSIKLHALYIRLNWLEELSSCKIIMKYRYPNIIYLNIKISYFIISMSDNFLASSLQGDSNEWSNSHSGGEIKEIL